MPPDWFAIRHDPTRGSTGSVLRLLYYPAPPSRTSLKGGTGATNGEAGEADDDDEVRAGAHSDYGSITLLFQRRGQPGLEIQGADGEWSSVPVDPIAHVSNTSADDDGDGGALPILVNIGDLLSYWTNGLLRSTVHRVVLPRAENESRTGTLNQDEGGDRYSIAYFCHPLDEAELVPVPSEVVRCHRGGVASDKIGEERTMTARDHLNQRLAATYGVKKMD